RSRGVRPPVNVYRWLILACWLVFVVYWAIAAIDAKRSVRAAAWPKEIGLRFVLVVLIGVAVRFAPLRHALHNAQVDLARNTLCRLPASCCAHSVSGSRC